MKIEHISVSRTQCFHECEMRYKYKYHLKIPAAEEPIYFLFGKVVHKIAECFTRAKGKIPIAKISQDILSGKIELEPGKKSAALPLEYRRKLPNYLKHLIKLTEHIGFDGEIEWKFDLDLEPPNKKILTGLIDRLIQKNGRIFILDYKTTKKGKFRKTKETIHSDLQLQTYCRIAQRTFGVSADKIQAALYFLEDGQIVSVNFSQNVLDSVEVRLLDAYRAIEAKNADHVIGRVGQHCNNCDYKAICPFFRIKGKMLEDAI